MNTRTGRTRIAKARRTRKAMLVYQAGISNVFTVTSFNLADYGRDARRICQADFRTCENFAAGLKFAGFTVKTVGCNMAGDIAKQVWTDDLESLPFSEQFRPVDSNE